MHWNIYYWMVPDPMNQQHVSAKFSEIHRLPNERSRLSRIHESMFYPESGITPLASLKIDFSDLSNAHSILTDPQYCRQMLDLLKHFIRTPSDSGNSNPRRINRSFSHNNRFLEYINELIRSSIKMPKPRMQVGYMTFSGGDKEMDMSRARKKTLLKLAKAVATDANFLPVWSHLQSIKRTFRTRLPEDLLCALIIWSINNCTEEIAKHFPVYSMSFLRKNM